MPVVPITNVNRVKNISGVTFQTSPSSQITYLALRTDTAKNAALMSNPKVRQAISMAVNREAYVATLEGNALGTNSILPTTVFGYKSEAEEYGYTYDLEAAKAIIESEGVKDEPIVILTSTVSTIQTVAEFIQASLKEAGFTNVELLPQEFATYLDTAKQANAFDLVLLTWANVTGDGTEFFDPNLHSVNSSKRVQYTNPAFDQLVNESRESMDMDVRLEKLDAANKLALEDAVVVPLFNSFNTFAHSDKYKDVVILPGTYFRVQGFKLAD
jgi:peptide/nickel transport system substrate-binding protein